MLSKRVTMLFSLGAVLLLGLAVTLGSVPSASAQGSTPVVPTSAPMTMPMTASPLSAALAGQPTVIRTGHVSALHGDPQPGTSNTMAMQIYLIDAQGNAIILNMDYTQALHLNGQLVTVQGKLIAARSPDNTLPYDQLYVTSITGNTAPQSIVPQAISGSYPWVSVLCRFSDTPTVTPKPPSYIDGLMSSTYPGVNSYWLEQSYGQANINGTTTTQWYNLTHPHNYYYTNGVNGSFDLIKLATDCSTLALNDVTFANYTGINFIFNGSLDGYAWGGGGASVTQNGVTHFFRTTWMPPWGYTTQSVMAHEMGHGFGLSHSAGGMGGGLGYPYTSDWDVMSSGGRACEVNNPTYGCIGTGTIAYHKDFLGWIPAARKMTVTPGHSVTITIEQLDLPVSSTDYLMAQIPIPGGNTFYTVESRIKPGGNGYDDAIRANAVIIHQVDQARSEPAHVVDSNSDGNNNVNDPSAEWTPGKTYTDSANKISVAVISQGTSSFTVTISNAPTGPVIDSIGVYRSGTFYLRLHNTQGAADLSVPFTAGSAPYPIVGDWTGVGYDTIGVYDQATGTFYLRNSNTAGAADGQFAFGNPNDKPLSGRWHLGALSAGVGVYRSTNGILYMKNGLNTGFSDYSDVLGNPGDVGVAGDWTGKGFDSPGVYRPGESKFYLSNQVINGIVFSDITALYGNPGDTPVIGDWIAQGHDGIGLFRQSVGYTYLRNTVSTGAADNTFFYGSAGDVPVAGHWQATYPPVAPPTAPILIPKTVTPANPPNTGSAPGGNQISG